jgi:hypothetical protein
VNRRLALGIQPDLVLVNERSRTIVIHDVTAQATSGHLAKGARYKSYFETSMPGYTVKYSEGYWDGLEDLWEALDSKGNLYLPGTGKP